MFRDLERLYSCRILAWAEPTDDGVQFIASQRGRLIVADSLGNLLLALSSAAVYALAA